MLLRTRTLINEFLESEKAGGFVLIFCTIISLLLANSPYGNSYVGLWNTNLLSKSIAHWINDGLMTIFFLLLGLELKREFLEGQFSNLKNALLPVVAAIGGMLLPAGFHLLFNYGTATQSGAGIPMATDAAFALAILSVVGKKAPFALKMLLVAIAVIDDLCAIVVIAVFYTQGFDWMNFGMAMGIFGLLWLLGRVGLKNLLPFIFGGVVMWYFMLHSGIHATISGVLLAIALPYTKGFPGSPSHKLQHRIHLPVAFIILPLFALANMAMSIEGDIWRSLSKSNSYGILTGLLFGKPLGVLLFSFVAVKLGIASLGSELKWKHVLAIGVLAGVGFTIAVFISVLAFNDPILINESKIAVLIASAITSLLAFLLLSRMREKAVIKNH